MGGMIAYGFRTLTMLSKLLAEIWEMGGTTRSSN